MFRALTLTVLAMALAGPVLAATTATTPPAVTCSKATATSYKPQADLTAMLAKDGLKVIKIKTEKGCYEVYATDVKGKKVNQAYNAETLEKVANVEAGEN